MTDTSCRKEIQKVQLHKVECAQAPAALGPYSQAVCVSLPGAQMLFLSGQLPIDPSTGKLIATDIRSATRCTLDNLEAILQEAGCTWEQVVRVEIFLKDLNEFPEMNEEYRLRFRSSCLPARQTIQVAKLPLDAPLEISCIAILPEVQKFPLKGGQLLKNG